MFQPDDDFLRSKHVALNDIDLAVLTVHLHNNYTIDQRDVQPEKRGFCTYTQIASCILNRLHNSFAFRDHYSKSDLQYNHHMSANISINLASKLRDTQAHRSKADYKLVT